MIIEKQERYGPMWYVRMFVSSLIGVAFLAAIPFAAVAVGAALIVIAVGCVAIGVVAVTLYAAYVLGVAIGPYDIES